MLSAPKIAQRGIDGNNYAVINARMRAKRMRAGNLRFAMQHHLAQIIVLKGDAHEGESASARSQLYKLSRRVAHSGQMSSDMISHRVRVSCEHI